MVVRRRCLRWSTACDGQRELQRARWCCGACAPSRSATSNTSPTHCFPHGQCIYTLHVQYFFTLITRRRRVKSLVFRSKLFHYGIYTFPSQCQRHLKAATHPQMASVKRAPSPANHAAVARSSVMALTLFARDALRVAIKPVSTNCKRVVYPSAYSNTHPNDLAPELHPSLIPRNWRTVSRSLRLSFLAYEGRRAVVRCPLLLLLPMPRLRCPQNYLERLPPICRASRDKTMAISPSMDARAS